MAFSCVHVCVLNIVVQTGAKNLFIMLSFGVFQTVIAILYVFCTSLCVSVCGCCYSNVYLLTETTVFCCRRLLFSFLLICETTTICCLWCVRCIVLRDWMWFDLVRFDTVRYDFCSFTESESERERAIGMIERRTKSKCKVPYSAKQTYMLANHWHLLISIPV